MAPDARHRFIAWTDLIGVVAAKTTLGCDRTMVAHIRSGRRTPSLKLAARIEWATRALPGGPIMAAAWVRAEQAPEAA